ncbi:uncharacterized protein LOC130635882 [Hydractinia symbiolongicarpus]|uniref:uncharacterized protein LOC130635882 n=1 Tax=Hydractinia symbiolongicarpus TaxID=13093 RepID=UPI002551B3AF|nr:uncharacterized protein LOC130635882 [Hydractinia symbiolongicarpus]XP_057301385.1 uncharacterized protein LOC130635882 [Hydractinia symbiolongicarpus]
MALAKFTAAVSAAEKLKNLIHTTSSNKIGTPQQTAGFEFLNVRANAQSTKGINKDHLLKSITKYMEPLAAGNPDLMCVVDEAREVINADAEEHQEQSFVILTENGAGSAYALFIYFQKREDGKYNFRKLLFCGNFRLAADVCIVHHSKNNIFYSKSEDVVKYIPRRGITQQDVTAFLEVMIPKIAQVMVEFVPDDRRSI